MKFISKNSNLRIVLRPGIPAEPLTGRAAIPAIYVKFEDGVVNVNDQERCDMMMNHPGYNSDFILSDEDPYARKPVEPEHDLIAMQYGSPGKNMNPKPMIQLTPEIKKELSKIATNMAIDIAKEMAPKMAIELLRKMKEESDKENKAGSNVKSKAKNVKAENTEEKVENDTEEK